MLPKPADARAAAAALRTAAAEQRARAYEDSDRLRRSIWKRGLLEIMTAAWFGVACVLWSFHTTNSTAAWIAFWGGLGVGDGGALFCFVRTWKKAEAVGP